ncbi:MAG: MerR family transcriptional regulator [Actinobacteria bacterium]|nr:MerR family transcriptional regulator [Actinomycetota bacterium]
MDKKWYGIGELARIAHVSERTLRYYDQIGLLTCARTTGGYRTYSAAEVDRLQQILLFRELEVPVAQIADLLDDTEEGRKTILREQRRRLCRRGMQIQTLVGMIDRTLASLEGEDTMSDADKFDGFAQAKIEENEAKYGAEIRENYGDERVDASNAKLRALSKEEFEDLQTQGDALYRGLADCFTSGELPNSAAAQELVAKHHTYLGNFGDFYTKEVYLSLGEGYASDSRFVEFYDAYAPGLASWFRDAIEQYCFSD